MFAAGFVFAVWTMRLFVTEGRGTPAPWAPPSQLVVRGPYRHFRNPTTVAAIEAAWRREVVALRSSAEAIAGLDPHDRGSGEQGGRPG